MGGMTGEVVGVMDGWLVGMAVLGGYVGEREVAGEGVEGGLILEGRFDGE